MEKKKFILYTEEERKKLLIHWFIYYSDKECSLKEISDFKKLVEEDSLLIGKMALLSYSIGCFNQPYLMATRDGKLQEYLNSIKRISSLGSYRKNENFLWEKFLDEIVDSYNVNGDSDQLLLEIENDKIDENEQDEEDYEYVAFGDEEELENDDVVTKHDDNIYGFLSATYRKVMKMYKRCLLNKHEIKDNGPRVDFVFGEGVLGASLFSSERIEKYKEEIHLILDDVCEADDIISFFKFNKDINGVEWAKNYETVDVLIRLGTAIGEIQFEYDNDVTGDIVEYVPCIKRCVINNINDIRKSKDEYPKVLEKFNDNYS